MSTIKRGGSNIVIKTGTDTDLTTGGAKTTPPPPGLSILLDMMRKFVNTRRTHRLFI